MLNTKLYLLSVNWMAEGLSEQTKCPIGLGYYMVVVIFPWRISSYNNAKVAMWIADLNCGVTNRVIRGWKFGIEW